MFLALPPTPELATLVNSYWFIKDIPGKYEGQPIRTSPVPAAVLSVNMGRPNAAEDGSLVPRASLLGLQSRVRSWRSWSNTYFVMAMLTIPGVVRLFPHTGRSSADKLLDLAAIAGDACAHSLSSSVTTVLEPEQIAARLDGWLLAQLASSAPVPESARIAVAHNILRLGGSVATAAEAVNTDRRQLQRWFHRHLGFGPKDVSDLGRLHDSLKAVQTRIGNPTAGFSDQAHQIRSWQRRLGVTPGAYSKRPRSPLVSHFSSNTTNTRPAFYL